MSAVLLGEAVRSPVAFDGDDEPRYEIIDGIKVEMPPMSADASGITSDLAHYLTMHGMERGLGKGYAEMLIKLPIPIDRNRRPDAIYVSYERWAKGRAIPQVNAWPILPDICVEVVSPTDLAEEQWVKVCEYFDAGVRRVWVVYPRQGHIHVFDGPLSCHVLTRADTLDGGDVLPEFRLALSELFPSNV